MAWSPSLFRCFVLLSLTALATSARAEDFAKVFHEQIAPVLVKNCLECHNANTRKGGLSLETLADATRGGDSGSALAVGKAGESLLYTNVISEVAGERPEMPLKKEPLTSAETELIRRWIDAGAPWPKEIVLKERAKADKSFWSFQPLADVAPPETPAAPEAWRAHPIDRFVFARLNEQSLAPNPPAGPRELIRRITYDLIGLPPSLEEVAAFERECQADRPKAIDALVDRLLASPHYGEHWGRHWLDVIRFGESRGYERNEIITNLWPFRDYVIESFNADKPFDRFIHEHLAGDVIGAGDPAVEIGSAFLVAGPYDDVGNQDAVAAAQIRADQMDEMIRATGEAFLGVTIGCARCHDHKFDPLTQQDYYALFATFNGTVHGPREVATPDEIAQRDARLKPLQAERQRVAEELKAATDARNVEKAAAEAELKRLDAEIAQIPKLNVWWVGTHRPAPGPFHLFLGGSPQKPGPEAVPASLQVFDGQSSSYRLDGSKTEAERRVALAHWLTAPDNPLTPRVLANRVWQYHFGMGIVDTPSDFGYMGGRPTHPELLDWLTRQLVAGGWKLKPLHRLIVTSQAYQQSGAWREAAGRVDGDSRFLWRFPPRRLTAEEVRDTLLVVAGKLDTRRDGPGFRLYEYQQDNVATYVPLDVHGPETYRRAVYHHNARAARVDVLTDFDAPDPAFADPRRASTTSPLQSLTLLNHRFALDMAQAFAERLSSQQDVPAKVRRAFVLAYQREPDAAELAASVRLVESHGLRALCRALLNSNELIFVE